MAAQEQSFSSVFELILKPEKRFYGLMLVYAVAISALSLSLPLSVQVLISTVANTALLQPVIVLSAMLFALLTFAGFFAATQVYLMELFERRFYARVVSEVSLRLIYAQPAYMQSINRDELINRYFDIMTVQKSLPPLLVGALATILQTIVGVTVTSFYHPLFLFFNIAVLIGGYVVFRIFHRGASNTSVTLSGSKYAAANWLETLAHSNNLFKSRRMIDYAISRTEAARDAYLREHRRHFHYSFAQIVGFLLLYATVSSVLLGLGGWLVIRGELTIGQLVAAELILTAIFYGLSRSGYYLELYYDLYAALVKLSQLYRIPLELHASDDYIKGWQPHFNFDDVRTVAGGRNFSFSFTLPAGGSTLIATRSNVQIRAFTDVLQNYVRPQSGLAMLGDHSIDDFHPHRLRDEVHVVDSVDFPECSISEFLRVASPAMSLGAMRQLLDELGVHLEVQVPDLDEMITPDGYPLSASGTVKLKIAYAIASSPKILVLTTIFDTLSQESRESAMRCIKHRLPDTTTLCFSHRVDTALFDRYMMWGFDKQSSVSDINALSAAYAHNIEQDRLVADPNTSLQP